jgi:hypothetical protein
MCFKKIASWFRPDPVVPLEPTKRRALLFGINNYPGTNNDLDGCLNDVDDNEKKLTGMGFACTVFKDSQVTCSSFYEKVKATVLSMRPGDYLIIGYSGHGTQIPSGHETDGYCEALYLYDGAFSDDRLMELQQMTPEGAIVVAKFDSCFAGGMAKNPVKSRYYQIPGVPKVHKKARRIAKADSKWVIFSGCGEGQTSADATFNGRPNGAFTYYDNKCFSAGTSFSDEITKIKTHLPGHGFDQAPELLGKTELFTYKY